VRASTRRIGRSQATKRCSLARGPEAVKSRREAGSVLGLGRDGWRFGIKRDQTSTAEGDGAMAFMVKDGFRLYYEDTGGNAPTLLFLHGAGGNHLSWWQQVPVFAEEYRCVTVDQRGFGQSPDVAGGPGPAALGADALALLDHLGIAQAALVAQSMGGWAAVGAAVQMPERFWAVVLANTVGNLSNAELAALRQKLAATSPPRPAMLWQAALGETFRKAHPAHTFLYAQIAGLNAPLPADFRT